MAGLVSRFAQQKAITFLKEGAHKLFSKYLLITNTSIAFGLAGSGDLINQHYEKLRHIRTEWSPVRTRNQCIQGLIFGPAYHFWYIFLDRLLPGYTVRVVLKKVFIDQLMAPVSVGVYLSALGSLEGLGPKDIIKDIKKKGKSLLIVEWTFGPITQLFNFFLLPTRFRVLYDSVVCLSFDAYYSYIKYRKGENVSTENPFGRSLKRHPSLDTDDDDDSNEKSVEVIHPQCSSVMSENELQNTAV